MLRYVAVNNEGKFLEVKGQDVFMTKEDAEKAVGKKTGFEVRPVPVGSPLQVLKPRVAPADEARKQAVKTVKKTSSE